MDSPSVPTALDLALAEEPSAFAVALEQAAPPETGPASAGPEDRRLS